MLEPKPHSNTYTDRRIYSNRNFVNNFDENLSIARHHNISEIWTNLWKKKSILSLNWTHNNEPEYSIKLIEFQYQIELLTSVMALAHIQST